MARNRHPSNCGQNIESLVRQQHRRDYTDTPVGRVMRACRTLEGTSQYSFCVKYGLTQTTVCNVENGYTDPTNLMLHRFMDALGDAFFEPFITVIHCHYCGVLFEPATDRNLFCCTVCASHYSKSPVNSFIAGQEVVKKISPIGGLNEQARALGLTYGQLQAQERLSKL